MGHYNLRNDANEHWGEILSVNIEYHPCPSKILPISAFPKLLRHKPHGLNLIPTRGLVTRDMKDRLKSFFCFWQ